MDERDDLNEDGGRIGGCPCCGAALRPAQGDVRTGHFFDADQGPGTILYLICPHCRERLIGDLPIGQRWADTDPAGVVWYSGGHRDPMPWEP